MKRALRWMLLFGAVASLGGAPLVGFCFLSFLFFGPGFFANEFDKDEVVYAASAIIDGFDFEVKLYRNNPILAEYRKVVKVQQSDKIIVEREFLDPGGLASFYLLRHGDRISLLDGVRDGFVLEVRSGEISEVHIDSIPRNFPEQAFGRFMFVYQQKRTYQWVPNEDTPLKGK